MTVRELKEKLENVPDDAVVYYQRIEDHYFDCGWKTTEIETSDYIKAFTAKYHEDSNAFVVNAHY